MIFVDCRWLKRDLLLEIKGLFDKFMELPIICFDFPFLMQKDPKPIHTSSAANQEDQC
jgi:hypothetical protein